MLELRDIVKRFGDVEVLKGISASIDKGELLTFVGPSGCGKTLVIDQYNPGGSTLFGRGDEVRITVPPSVHALKKDV